MYFRIPSTDTASHMMTVLSAPPDANLVPVCVCVCVCVCVRVYHNMTQVWSPEYRVVCDILTISAIGEAVDQVSKSVLSIPSLPS